MFYNCIKSEKEKLNTKIIAMLLVITLTFANFSMLGAFIFESIAMDLNGNNTNDVENIQFEAFFDPNDKSITEISKDINSEELKLYVSIQVKGEGILENAKIDFTDSNFEIKGRNEKYGGSIAPITAGNSKIIEIPIVARKDEKYKINLLDMKSLIYLEGEYVDNNGNVTTLKTARQVKVEWKTNSITSQDINFSQEIITNKMYEINGENKRVVQVLLKTNIQDNKVPVKTQTIEMQIPSINAQPEQIKVMAKSTKATNGKTFMEFGNEEYGKYEYKEEEQKVYIYAFNNPNNENEISWLKNEQDEYVVTFVYNQDVEVTPFISNAKTVFSIYGMEEQIEKESNITLEEMRNIGDVVNFEKYTQEDIYKGYMYVKQNTMYETKLNMFVLYSDLVDKMELSDIGEALTIQNSINTFKTTKIDRKQALNLLGTEGVIKIFNSEDKQTPIYEINLSQETEDEEYIIEYNSEVSKITIETSKPIKEGKLEIINEKQIKVNEESDIAQAHLMTTGASLTVLNSNNEMRFNISRVSSVELKEPESSIEIHADKNSISNQCEEDLKLTVVLNTIESKDKLFKNPILNIELPSEFEEVSIEKISSPLFDDELTIKAFNVQKNELGNNVLIIELEGEQTKYNTNLISRGTNIIIDLKVKAKEFMANKDVEIKGTCLNGEETATANTSIYIVSKEELLTRTNVKVNENQINSQNINITDKETAKNVSIQVEIINNYSSAISNFELLQKLQTEDENLLNSIKLQSVTIDGIETEVLYAVDSNSNEWTAEFNEERNFKAFKIKLDGLESRQSLVLTYNLLIQEGIETSSFANSFVIINGLKDKKEINKEFKFQITFDGANNIEQNEEGNIIIEQKDGIRLVITPDNTNEVLHEKQIITYKIEVINTLEEEFNNLQLVFTKSPIASILNNVTLAELEMDIDKSEAVNKSFQIEHLAPGEKIEKYLSIYIEGIDENEVVMANNVLVRNSEGNEMVSANIEQTVKKSYLNLTYSTKTNNEGVFENSEITYILAVNNPSQEETINNCLVQIKIPEGTTFIEDKNNQNNSEEDDLLNDSDEEDIWQKFNYDDINKILTKRIEKIEPEESIYLKFTVKVNKQADSSADNKIQSSALVILDNEVYETNKVIKEILPIKYSIEINTQVEEAIQKYGDIKYVIKIKNEGQYNGVLKIEDEISNNIAVASIITYIEGDESDKEEELLAGSENKTMLNISKSIEPGETLVIEITGIVSEEQENTETIDIQNAVNLVLNNEVINSKSITNTIRLLKEEQLEDEDEKEIPKKEPTYDFEGEDEEQDDKEEDDIEGKDEQQNPQNPSNPGNPNNPSDNNKEEENKDKENSTPEENKTKFSISGLAWIDENKNGIRDSYEKILEGIKVKLLDKNGNVVKDENGKELSILTSITGTYKFNNLEKGEYIVIFEYDNSKYSVTVYQEEYAKENTNSDFISKEISLNGENKTVAISDTLKIEDENLRDIDIGLTINPIFDLSLNKYISKVTVTTDTGVTTYDYTYTDFTKIEIPAKKIAGAVIVVEYEIEIQNNGTIAGYVEDIFDYMPQGFTFNSNSNTDWYEDSEGILHNINLATESISPDESKRVKIVFSKKLNSSSTGTIENIAEIGESKNINGIKDIDSIAGNNIGGEDDISSARLIISIATGSTSMYIGIVILSLLLLGVGIYLINKNVLRREDITWEV